MGMLTPLLHITMPEDDGEDRHFAPIIFALQAMINVNRWHIQRGLERSRRGKGPRVPLLYESGVRYKEDPPGQENWKDCLAVIAEGTGDCDRLVAWRVAELDVAGIQAEPIIKWQQVPRDTMIRLGHPAHMVPRDGISMVHVLVRYHDPECPSHGQGQRGTGTAYRENAQCTCPIEDPSKILGMGGDYTNGI